MIRISVSRADATVLETETLTAGRIGLVCEFVFSSDWDDLEKVAVFDGEVTKEVALDENNRAIVPAECMATAGYKLRCGVTGLNAEQVVVLPTVYVNAGKIRESAEIADSSIEEITPSLASQVISRANEALRVANELASDAESGAFDGEDGVSPTIAVSEITGGHALTITDKNGTRTVNVLDGEDGATGPAGTPGAAGADGYSPTVAITTITGGHRVTITDANGTHSFDVMDGEDSSGGDSGPNIYGGSDVPLVFVTSDTSGWVEANLSDIGATPAVDDYVIGAYSSNIYMFKVTAILNGSASGYGAIKLTGPTKTSDLTNDSGFYSKPSTGIPKSDLADAVQTSLGKADTALQSVPSTYRTAAAQDTIDAGKIDKPSNPATGAFLVWNGSAWVAQTLSTWQGGSY